MPPRSNPLVSPAVQARMTPDEYVILCALAALAALLRLHEQGQDLEIAWNLARQALYRVHHGLPRSDHIGGNLPAV